MNRLHQVSDIPLGGTLMAQICIAMGFKTLCLKPKTQGLQFIESKLELMA